MKKRKEERRRYVRLDSVFPVEFRIKKGDKILTDWIQGFTRNVSFGGICLETKFLGAWHKSILKDEDVYLDLVIHMPIESCKETTARIAWQSEEKDFPLSKTLLGLEFLSMDRKPRKRLVFFAYNKIWLPKILIGLSILFLTLSIYWGYNSFYLTKKHQALLREYVSKLQELTSKKNELFKLSTEMDFLVKNIQRRESFYKQRLKDYQALKKDYEDLKKREKEFIEDIYEYKIYKDILALKEKNLKSLEEELELLRQENKNLKQKLALLSEKKELLTFSILNLRTHLKEIEKVNIESFYVWLKNHQNQHTGLLVSFEGDPSLENVGFSYDQALSVCAFILFNDYLRAEKILKFYKNKAKRYKGGFFNAYYVDNGEPAEYIIHCGPNIWIGIATLHYIKKTGDYTYLPLAEEVAGFVLSIQNMDPEGGIKGGPQVEWYSTEHNLDAYAFLGMLYELTHKNIYKKAQEKIFNWLKEYAYSNLSVPVNRGKGDSTIATDTYAWSIASLGPSNLIKAGMDPEEIMNFAENHCKVSVNFKRPEGIQIKVEGFDFAPHRHLARGGVISCEWTAQMILSFKILSNYFYQQKNLSKSLFYFRKAMYYLTELRKMIIASPSPLGQGRWCLPYASESNVDTGHGWRTPQGKDTGSVASTCYLIFAYKDFNPLSFEPAFDKRIYDIFKEVKKETVPCS